MNNFFCTLFSCKNTNELKKEEQKHEISLTSPIKPNALFIDENRKSKIARIDTQEEEEYINKLPIRRLDTGDGVEYFDLVIIGGGSAGVSCAV
jgi:hypothetical protein